MTNFNGAPFKGVASARATGLKLGDCSMLFALVEGEELVGFTRVLSDFVYKALILDVIIARPYRGKGWGQSLMQQVIDHPRLQSTHHLELYCLPEMEPFYKTF